MKLETIKVVIKYQHVLIQVLREHVIVFGAELHYTRDEASCLKHRQCYRPLNRHRRRNKFTISVTI
jgi:hypothetical protein